MASGNLCSEDNMVSGFYLSDNLLDGTTWSLPEESEEAFLNLFAIGMAPDNSPGQSSTKF